MAEGEGDVEADDDALAPLPPAPAPQAASPKAEAPRPKTVSTFRRFIRVPMSKPSPWSTTSSSGRGSRRPS